MNQIVTCHVDGCMNKDIPMELMDPVELVVCGPCGTEILDKVNV